MRQRVGKGRGAKVRDPRSPRKTSSGQRRSSHPTKTGRWAAGLDPILRNFGIRAFISLIGLNFPDFSLVLILISLILYSSQISHQVLVMKETLVFITPPQPHIETIMQNVSETFPDAKNRKLFNFLQGWKIKLVGIRLSDKNISKTKFDFEYFPEDFYGESTEKKVQ